MPYSDLPLPDWNAPVKLHRVQYESAFTKSTQVGWFAPGDQKDFRTREAFRRAVASYVYGSDSPEYQTPSPFIALYTPYRTATAFARTLNKRENPLVTTVLSKRFSEHDVQVYKLSKLVRDLDFGDLDAEQEERIKGVYLCWQYLPLETKTYSFPASTSGSFESLVLLHSRKPRSGLNSGESSAWNSENDDVGKPVFIDINKFRGEADYPPGW